MDNRIKHLESALNTKLDSIISEQSTDIDKIVSCIKCASSEVATFVLGNIETQNKISADELLRKLQSK